MRFSKQIQIGNIKIGANAPVSIQSMCNTKTENIDETLKQINALCLAGCELVRLAIPNQKAVDALKIILRDSPLPIIADIHFDWQLALGAISAGVHAIRLNPANLNNKEKIIEIVSALKERKIPLRIGVNKGSQNKKDLVSTALEQIRIFEDLGYNLLKISIKTNNVKETISAYREIAKLCDYPLHLGITEAGLEQDSIIKSAMGIGILLNEGIGNTIRVSMTDDPVKEVIVAKKILQYLNLRQGVELISCPSCGRTHIKNFTEKVKLINQRINDLNIKTNLKIAIMGCEVNGPGEAKEADIGIAFCKEGQGILIKKGEIIAKFQEEELIETLIKEIISIT